VSFNHHPSPPLPGRGIPKNRPISHSFRKSANAQRILWSLQLLDFRKSFTFVGKSKASPILNFVGGGGGEEEEDDEEEDEKEDKEKDEGKGEVEEEDEGKGED